MSLHSTSFVNKEDIKNIVETQRSSLNTLEKSCQMLESCNRVAELQFCSSKVKNHTETLTTLKKDLQSIHTRLRVARKPILKKPEVLAWYLKI